ncbi:MAG: metallophosphoesterase [Prevotella sp.]|nr:metallophosphoesterase [Prevotella sp.]
MFFLRFLIPPIILLLIVAGLVYGVVRNVIRLCRHKLKIRHAITLAFCLLIIGIITWGFTLGFEAFRRVEVEYASKDLPEGFDGYRIVMFSDAHVGNFHGSRAHILRHALHEMNAEKADAIVFCGDIENQSPEELLPFIDDFKGLHAKDGVFSILGNHDYSLYMHNADEKKKQESLARTIATEESFGWKVLRNENTIIHRGEDSIFIVGEENQGSGMFPKYANVEKAIQGIPNTAFTIMLQHDPTAWREHILKKTTAQLTLSGHTHAGQFSVFGWSPASHIYDEVRGAYYTEDGRMLYVSSGLGGVVPFRFNMPGEIVVITLRCKQVTPKD